MTSDDKGRLVLLVSRECSFCKELLKNTTEEIFDLNVLSVYKEDDAERFDNFMKKAKVVIDKTIPNLKGYDTITPLLLITNESTDVIHSVVVGYSSIETVLKKLHAETKIQS